LKIERRVDYKSFVKQVSRFANDVSEKFDFTSLPNIALQY